MNPRYLSQFLSKSSAGVATHIFSAFGTIVALCGFVGCDSKPIGSKFVLSERTEELISPARKRVQDQLTEDFGTPQDLVAWLRFPVDYGMHKGTIKDVEATDQGSYKFAVDWTDADAESLRIRRGAGLMMTSGDYAGTNVKVNHYAPESGRIHIDAFMNPAPAVGDELTVVGGKLQAGRMLYMEHCVHCHGTSGDGNGPTAKYLNPKPRDYRLGKFKFTTTKPLEKIATSDLKRTVKLGIPGTYMPSFMLLKDDELSAIVEYVRWLAIRGEMEARIVNELHGDYSTADVRERVKGGETNDEIEEELQTLFDEDFSETVDDLASGLAADWLRADEEPSLILPNVPRVPDSLESQERGKKLYLSGDTKCVSCHGPTGRGDGSSTEEFWDIPGSQPIQKYAVRGLHDDWGNPIKPRDLTRGIYRGGRRPIDIFCRIYAGIKGTQMPAFGGKTGPKDLKDEDIWDIVNYVLSIPYETDRAIHEPLSIPPLEQTTAATE